MLYMGGISGAIQSTQPSMTLLELQMTLEILHYGQELQLVTLFLSPLMTLEVIIT